MKYIKAHIGHVFAKNARFRYCFLACLQWTKCERAFIFITFFFFGGGGGKGGGRGGGEKLNKTLLFSRPVLRGGKI